MKAFSVKTITLLICMLALCTALSHAQPLTLADDASVKKGTLGNGLTYYLISDSSLKGTADYSLVRYFGFADDTTRWYFDLLGAMTLNRTYSFDEGQLLSFAARAGVSLGRDLDFECRNDCSVLSFRNIPSFSRPVSDSLLLAMANIAVFDDFDSTDVRRAGRMLESYRLYDRCDICVDSLRKFAASHNSLSRQALVIVGDIDAAALERDLSLIFLSQPAIHTARDERYVLFAASDSIQVSLCEDPANRYGILEVSYRSKALPLSIRGSVVRVITKQMREYMGDILVRRVRRLAEAEEFDLYECSARYGQDPSSRDAETFTLRLGVPQDQAARALRALAGELAHADACGFSMDEYRYARWRFDNLVPLPSAASARKRWLEKAIGNYIEGTSLASPYSERQYLKEHPLSDSLGRAYLNRFAAAMIDSHSNVCVSLSVPSAAAGNVPGADSLSRAFALGWERGCDSLYVSVSSADPFRRDSVKIPSFERLLKTRFTRDEPLTGKKAYTLSNGMKVYCNQTQDDGYFHFSFAYKGGFASFPGFVPGTGVFYRDIIRLDSIAGMSYSDFDRLMECYGIQIDYDITADHVGISGKAPHSEAAMAMRVMNAIVNYRTADTSAFTKYVHMSKAMLSTPGPSSLRRDKILDTLIFPNYKYTLYRRSEALDSLDYMTIRKDVQERLFRSGDLTVAFASGLSQQKMQELCCSNLGWLQKGRRTRFGTQQSEQTITGRVTSRMAFEMARPLKSLDMLFAVPCVYSADNLYKMHLAAELIKARVNSVLAPQAMGADVSGYFKTLPDGHCFMRVSVSAPVSVRLLSVMQDVRSVMFKDSGNDAMVLEMAKKELVMKLESAVNSPDYWIAIINERYVDNKDFYSSYAAKIQQISLEEVRGLINDFEKGGCAELLVRPSNDLTD